MIKIGKYNSTSNSGGSSKNSTKEDDSRLVLIGSVLLSGSVFLNILLLLAACFNSFPLQMEGEVGSATESPSHKRDEFAKFHV